MVQKLGVLIHGAGWVSTQHIAAFKNNPSAEVVAICSVPLENSRRRAAEARLKVPCLDDYEKALALPGVDIVAIGTPQQFHAENTVAAARAGKHILIEKPAAQSLSELHAMREAVNAARVKTVVSFVLRWNPLFQRVKKMSADHAFGEIFCVETDYQSYQGDWWAGYPTARTRASGGSAFLVGGCHAVDALRWFAGAGEFEAADPIEIFAYNGGKRQGRTEQYNPITHTWHSGEPLEYPGLEIALVRFSNGVLGKVSANFECIQPYAFPVSIFGDRGTVKDNRIWTPARSNEKAWEVLPDIQPESSDVRHHPFQAEIDHFIDCILTGRESHCNLDDAVKTHEIVFAALTCYETRSPVSLPLTPGRGQ
jgi:predicted dehydrogenase